MHRSRRVGIVLFENVTALDLVGPAEAFAAARQGPAGSPRPAYEVLVLGLSRATCRSESGVRLSPDRTLDDCPPLDTLLIPGGSGLREPSVNARVVEFVQRRARRVRRIAAVCTGIYGLAPSGLLDGRRVTTHWAFCEDVARRFPRLELQADALFVKDGSYYTAAGVTSGIDLALALIEEDLGPARSLAVARELVVYLRRQGGQQQFSGPLQLQLAARERLRDLADHVVNHLDGDLSVPSLARKLGLSSRQLSRLCRKELGESPAALVARLRLDESRRLLLEPGSSVDLVSRAVGFGGPDVFRRAFERRFGLPPSAYRARFVTTSPLTKRRSA